MNEKPSPSRTSYAWQHRAELPGPRSALDQARTSAPSFEPARDPLRALALADLGMTEAQRRGSDMVRSERPHPVLRPSPVLALGADRAAFNARWDREVENAKRRAEDAGRAARREAFKAMRRSEKPISRVRRTGRSTAR